MMRGVRSSAVAVRAESGEILLESERLAPPKTSVGKIPLLRGVVNFLSTMVLGVKTLMKSAEVFGDEEEDMSKGAIAFAVVLGVALSVGLFILLPSLITDGILSLAGAKGHPLWSALLEGLFRIVLFVGYLLLTSLMKDIKRTYMYHGAEHKTINCYEHGLPLTVENVAASSKVHNRCGTTFLFLVVTISIITFALSNWLAYGVIGWTRTWWLNLVIRLVLLPLVAGISYEILKLFARLPDNGFTKFLRAPGLSLQAITTREPTPEMIEVAIRAFTAVLELDENPDAPTDTFAVTEYKKTAQAVRAILDGVDAEPAETDWIMCEVLKCKRGELAAKTEIKRVEHNKALSIAKRRAKGEPLAYVLGNAWFYGDQLKVNRAVLIPRPETELVAEQVVLRARARTDCRVLDLCTGSGCIAYVAARYGRASVTASDVSKAALSVARENCEGLDVTFVESNMFERLTGRYDILVSNPPYIPTGELASLQAEVKKEPVGALNGGADGLDFYREIASKAQDFVTEDGCVVLELGIGQAQAVAAMFGEGWSVSVRNDYDGVERILIAERAGKAD